MSGNNTDRNDQPEPERWLLIFGAALLAFGVVLLALRSVVFSLILITIGISLFACWLFMGVRARDRYRREQLYLSDYSRKPPSSFSSSSTVGERRKVCTCSVCNHTESDSCMQTRCPCCILTRNKQIIGHFDKRHQ